MAYFKLIGSASYSHKSSFTTNIYIFHRNQIVRIDSPNDVLTFRTKKDLFLEVDENGKELSLLDSQNPNMPTYSGVGFPKSYEKIDSIPESAKKQVAEIKQEHVFAKKQLVQIENKKNEKLKTLKDAKVDRLKKIKIKNKDKKANKKKVK